MSDKATPRPWHWSGNGPAAVFTLDADGAQDAHIADSSPADAALIVRAVNAHDGLVEALRKVANYANENEQVDTISFLVGLRDLAIQARTALRAAGVEP